MGRDHGMTGVLYEAVRGIAARQPDACAIHVPDAEPDRSLSYRELIALSDRLAAGLREHGVGADDAVAVSLGNSPGYVALILAVARIGARYVPLMRDFDAEDTATALRRTRPVLLVVDHTRPVLAEVDPAVPGAIACVTLAALGECARPAGHAPEYRGEFRMLWTSGSTGFPKTMVWRQDKFLAERRRWIADVGVTGRDVVFCRHTLDVAHATDLHVFAALLSGARLVLPDPDAPAADLLRQLEACQATVMSALPRHYEDLAGAAGRPGAADLSRLRRPLCGGAYLSSAVVRRAAEVLGIRIRQIYGSTEFGLGLGDMADTVRSDLGMVPVAGVGTRLAPLAEDTPDIGELVLRSDCTSEGYLDDAEADARTFRDGEFWTGDVARRAADGSYRILGRVAETMAATRGPLLAPMLDDEITGSCPVAESVALAVHPGAYRNKVLMIVRPAPDAAADLVRAAVGVVLSGHGLEGTVHCVDSIPRTPVGKVDKPLLRRRWDLEGKPR
jgi:acyl-coenzyme A synthetase/AMP-(fatty) acid ligase